MTPKGNSPETPDSVEQEQSAEMKPEQSAEPPFTETERLEQRAGDIDETLTDLRPAAQEDEQNLDKTEQTFKQEFPEPPAEFDEPPHTVQEVQELEGRQQEIQQQLGGQTEPERQPQPESEIPEGQQPEKGKTEEQPVEKTRPRLPHEAPVEVKATREQTAEHVQEQLAQALDKIYTAIENNGGQMPENPAGMSDLKNIFKGSRILSENAVAAQMERLKTNFNNFQIDKGHAPSREEFKGLGKNTLREQIGMLAQENPQEVQKSPFEKQQAERRATWQPGRSSDIPVQENPMIPQTEDKSRPSNREE